MSHCDEQFVIVNVRNHTWGVFLEDTPTVQ